MTPNEIKKEVGALALEPESEVEEGPFWVALNRAIAQVNRIRPMADMLVLHNRCLAVISEHREVQFGGDNTVVLQSSGCACVYLQIYGQGKIIFKKDGQTLLEKELINNNQTNEYRVVISKYTQNDTADIEVEISGRFAGTVVSAIFYSEKYSDLEEDIPSGNIYNTYHLKNISSDVGHVTRVIYEDRSGEREIEASDFMLPDGKSLWLLKSKPGKYKVHYTKKPKRLTVDDYEDDIGLDEDLQSLVPLLVCYYVWLEDKPELAQAMFAQYKQMEAEIKLQPKANRFPAFQDVYNGW